MTSSTSKNESYRPLRIAIIGAGLVGAFTATLLSKLDNVELTVFEKSAALREVGAWISMNNSSLELLGKVIDLKQLNSILYRGEKEPTYLARHWKTGELLHRLPEHGKNPNLAEARTHRVPLHQLILSHVPEGIIKYGYLVSGIRLEDEKCIIDFRDKSSHELDFVIAADGIYSKVRHQFFDNAAVKYKGTVAYRTVFPEELIADIPEVHDDTSVWISPEGDVMFLSRLGLKKYGVVAIIREPEEIADRLRWDGKLDESDVSRLKHRFKDWDPVISKVLDRTPELNAFPLGTAPWLDNLTIADKIAFVGDAAHPTAGAYGAGSSFGYADAWAIYRSLQETSLSHWSKLEKGKNTYDLKFALFLFNETRVGFLKRVEKQMTIDKEAYSRFLKTESNDLYWRWKVLVQRSGGGWMRSHDVELAFQLKRDEHLIELLEVFERNLHALKQ